jgi:hypothetical protein
MNTYTYIFGFWLKARLAGQVLAAFGAQVGAGLKGVAAPDVALMARIEAHMPTNASLGEFNGTTGTFIHAAIKP